MTIRASGSKGTGRLLAGIEAHAGHVCVVVVRAGGSVGTATVQVVEAKKCAGTDSAGVAAMCERLRVSSIVRVAPANECVARAASVPAGDVATMNAAAALLAEGELPADAPSHRRAAAVLPSSGKSGVRDVLLTAWVREGAAAKPLCKLDESWTTPMAAMAALRGAGAGAVLARPEVATACLLLSGEHGAAARVVVEDPDDNEAWDAGVRSAVDEARAATGGPDVTIPRSGLFLTGGTDDLHAKVSGVRLDEAWLDDFAVALGAAMLALDCPAGTAPLAGMRALAPKERVAVPIRFAAWISRPAVAWTVGVAAALLLVAGPWAFARQRAVISTNKAAQLDDAKSQTKDLGLRAAVYEQLEATRWPMTKLLSDIAGAAPVGTTIEDARISVEQGVTIRGVATSRELVNELERNLAATKLFRNIKQNRNVSKAGGGAEFDLSAQVDGAQVHLPVKAKEDFAAKNLASRLYDDPGALNTTIPVGAKREAVKQGRTDRSGASSSSSNVGDLSRRPAATPAAEPPPALTDAEINAMDRPTAMRGFSTRRNFLSTKGSGLDATVKARLESEVEKLKERMQKAGDGGDKK